MSKKKRLANVIFERLRFVSLPVLGTLRPQWLSVLAYHQVVDSIDDDYPFVRGTISATRDEFEKQVAFVKKHFSVVNFQMLSESLRDGRVPKRALIITFDDGYRSNYDVAYQVLKKHGVTATIFVSTQFVDSGQPFWFDKVAYEIYKMPPGQLSLNEGKHVLEIRHDNRREARHSLQTILSRVPNKTRLKMLNELEHVAQTKISEDDQRSAAPLNWEQIQQMSEDGIEIASHTVSHPYLASLTDEEIELELVESKKTLEAATGCDVKSVAYPAGSYDGRVLQCARRCGYEFGVSYKHDVAPFCRKTAHEIPRLHVETDVDYPLFVANLMWPQVFVRRGGGRRR